MPASAAPSVSTTRSHMVSVNPLRSSNMGFGLVRPNRRSMVSSKISQIAPMPTLKKRAKAARKGASAD